MKLETDAFMVRSRLQTVSLLFAGPGIIEPRHAMDNGDGNDAKMHTS